MRILIVSATDFETGPLQKKLIPLKQVNNRLTSFLFDSHRIDILVTGIGMVATAFWTSQRLTKKNYNLAINMGIAGSFNPLIKIGDVINVTSERLPELGAEANEDFLTLADLGLLKENEFPYVSLEMVNDSIIPGTKLAGLATARGITVNTVHGNEESILKVKELCHPDVESMEGAAFFYSCLIHSIPFVQLRAVSNVVERRERAKWNIPLAINNLTRTVYEVLTDVVEHYDA